MCFCTLQKQVMHRAWRVPSPALLLYQLLLLSAPLISKAEIEMPNSPPSQDQPLPLHISLPAAASCLLIGDAPIFKLYPLQRKTTASFSLSCGAGCSFSLDCDDGGLVRYCVGDDVV